eukprot:678442-Amphidinium_carterae.2
MRVKMWTSYTCQGQQKIQLGSPYNSKEDRARDDTVVPIVSCNRNMNVIEFCCDKHSTLGKPTKFSRGRGVLGFPKRKMSKSPWFRVPSHVRGEHGPRTPWRRFNDAKHGDDPDYCRRMREHGKTFDALWDNFAHIGEHCLSAQGTVVMDNKWTFTDAP